MGKGGPLAFLNKKTWHPGRIQNVEEVWKREQEAAKEQQKLKDLQKQIAEERAKEEMFSVAEAAGVKVRSDRLDWMYQGGVAARQEAEQRQAEKDKAEKIKEENATIGRAGTVDALPSFYSEDTPASANEMWHRLHADPLFAIKQQEIAARRNILSNPVQMHAIKKQVKTMRASRDSDDDHRSDDDEEDRHRRHKSRKEKRSRKEKEKKHKSHSKHRSRSRERRRKDYDDGTQRDGRRSRSHSRSPPRKRTHTSENIRHANSPTVPFPKDGASAQGARAQYGITYGARAPDVVRHQDRSDLAEATRRRLEEASRRKEEEQRAAEALRRQQHGRQHHVTGRLTDEERRKKLAEMTAAAQQHDSQRYSRIKEYEEMEAREESDRKRNGTEGDATAKFMHNATREMYGTKEGRETSLADAVGRRKAFQQRERGNG